MIRRGGIFFLPLAMLGTGASVLIGLPKPATGWLPQVSLFAARNVISFGSSDFLWTRIFPGDP
jgi:hypothetical protein